MTIFRTFMDFWCHFCRQICTKLYNSAQNSPISLAKPTTKMGTLAQNVPRHWIILRLKIRYISLLFCLGAQVQVDGRVAVIEGVDHLNGAPVQACDLRAGAALVIAGLAAQGVTQLSQVQFIERGYEDLVGKLRAVGADIRVEEIPESQEAAAHIG